ncbi:hypothetical protein E4T42_07382 [Aureobasidium subglaciale]|nr:hypothetical protein E4T42_07382 [Aureobasidium subglaciale]
MLQAKGWFRTPKRLHTRRLPYYEDVYRQRDPEDEILQSIHTIDSESDLEPEVFTRRYKVKHRMTSPKVDKPSDANANAVAMSSSVTDEAGVPKTIDRSTVSTIDDDDSDVDALFVSEIRRYAQDDSDKANGEDDDDGMRPQGTGSKNGVDAVFLAQLKRFAQTPERNNEEDEDLIQINNRGRTPYMWQDTIAEIVTAEGFRAMHLLGAQRYHASLHQDQEGDHDTVRALVEASVALNTTELVDDSHGREVDSQSTKTLTRAHSWASSQSSNYQYSDDDIEVGKARRKARNEKIRSDERWTIASRNPGSEGKSGTEDKSGSEGRESAQPVDIRSDQALDDIHDNNPDDDDEEGDDAEDAQDQDQDKTRDDTPRSLSTLSKPSESMQCRRFGMFASNPTPVAEMDFVDLTNEPQPSLRDLVRQGRMESGSSQIPTTQKKPRYDLRVRRQPVTYNEKRTSGKSTVDTKNRKKAYFDLELEHTARETRPRRQTRSMTASRRKLKTAPRVRAKVEVVIPAAGDRSAWKTIPSPLPKRRQSSFAEEDDQTKQHGSDGETALAGQGRKRLKINLENKTEARKGHRSLEMVLID